MRIGEGRYVYLCCDPGTHIPEWMEHDCFDLQTGKDVLHGDDPYLTLIDIDLTLVEMCLDLD